jgi:hypothetical protein
MGHVGRFLPLHDAGSPEGGPLLERLGPPEEQFRP